MFSNWKAKLSAGGIIADYFSIPCAFNASMVTKTNPEKSITSLKLFCVCRGRPMISCQTKRFNLVRPAPQLNSPTREPKREYEKRVNSCSMPVLTRPSRHILKTMIRRDHLCVSFCVTDDFQDSVSRILLVAASHSFRLSFQTRFPEQKAKKWFTG